jgi:hypothetical protein
MRDAIRSISAIIDTVRWRMSSAAVPSLPCYIYKSENQFLRALLDMSKSVNTRVNTREPKTEITTTNRLDDNVAHISTPQRSRSAHHANIAFGYPSGRLASRADQSASVASNVSHTAQAKGSTPNQAGSPNQT